MDKTLKNRDQPPCFETVHSVRMSLWRWTKDIAVAELASKPTEEKAHAKNVGGTVQSVKSGIKKLRKNKVVFDVSSHGSIVVSPSEYQLFLKKKE